MLARGVSPEVDDLRFKAISAADGSFSVKLPYGTYRLTAVKTDQSWIQPAEIGVTVAAGATSGGHVLRFRNSDVTLSGNINLQNGSGLSGSAYVYAYTADGALVHGIAAISNGAGSYTLPVVQGLEWKVGAAFETTTSFWSGRGTVTINGPNASLDLSLMGSQAKTAPVSATFDPSQAQSLALADGTEVFIPAGGRSLWMGR